MFVVGDELFGGTASTRDGNGVHSVVVAVNVNVSVPVFYVVGVFSNDGTNCATTASPSVVATEVHSSSTSTFLTKNDPDERRVSRVQHPQFFA